MKNQTKSRGPALGLLAMFGAVVKGATVALAPYSIGATGRNTRSAELVEWYQARAATKRARRAARIGASAYAKANAFAR